MAWVKLDDRFWSNRKVRRAGDAAIVYVRALSWSADNLTDGRIPIEDIGFIAAGCSDPGQMAQRCVDAGLFDIDGDDYVIADYLEYNDDRGTVLARRQADRERKAKGRAVQAESRRNPGGIQAEPANYAKPSSTAVVQAESRRNPDGIQAESARNPVVPSRPVPSHISPYTNCKTQEDSATDGDRWLQNITTAEAILRACGINNPKPTLDELAATRHLLDDGWTPQTLETKATELAAKADRNPRSYVWRSLPRAEKPPPPPTRRCPDCRGDYDNGPNGITRPECSTCDSTGKVPLYDKATS